MQAGRHQPKSKTAIILGIRSDVMMNKTIPVFDEAGNYIKDVFNSESPKRAGYLDKA